MTRKVQSVLQLFSKFFKMEISFYDSLIPILIRSYLTKTFKSLNFIVSSLFEYSIGIIEI